MENEPKDMGYVIGPNESLDIGESAVARIFHKAVHLGERHFTRPVTTFIDKEGRKFKASPNNVDIDIKDPSHVEVMLHSHRGEIITMTIGGLLVAGSLISLQRNRSQRRKMSNRDSSYLRPPRK